jgi:hypothetical protein
MHHKLKQFFSNYRNALIAWGVMTALVVVGLQLGIDKTLIGFVVVLVGIMGEGFAAMIAWIAFVPLIGPFIAKLLALPFFWLLNGVGYLASIVAIRRGYSKEVVNYRILTVVLLVGITIGYVLGKLV